MYMKKIIFTLVALISATCPALMAQSYIEEPARKNDGSIYLTVRSTIGEPASEMRSYTIRYDAGRRISLWVAYPLNASLIGHGSRGDGWEPEPAIDEKLQAELYRGFKHGSGYDRGHQIPSADRLDSEANAQTFRFTNATPQLHDFNGGIWAELEKVVRTWAKRSDTLYVVTGCIPGNKAIVDNADRSVNIPLAYYKAVLRRNRVRSGELQWSTCAVLLPHQIAKVGTWQENLVFFRKNSLSIRELEEVTGEEFFPLLGREVPVDVVSRIKQEAASEWWWK